MVGNENYWGGVAGAVAAIVVGAARWVRWRTWLGRMPRKRVARAVAASARAAGTVTRRGVTVSARVSVEGRA